MHERFCRYVLIITLLILVQSMYGQTAPDKKFAILPFTATGVNVDYVVTAESIFRMELSKQSGMEIVSQRKVASALNGELCSDPECAVKIGRMVQAGYAVLGRFSALGEKIIVQYFLIDLSTGKIILQDQTNAYTVEDLDTVMKRIAASIVNTKPISQNAEVGTIMQTETAEPARRATHRNFGLSFGYLFPQNGYDDEGRNFVLDLRTGYEMEDFTVGMLLGVRKGFAVNIYSSYLLSRTDFCPYVGGAFGFHWVSHQQNYYYREDGFDQPDKKKGDGFEFTLHGGIRAFRTYNFQLIFNLAYTITLNDFDDRAIIFTIGLL